MNTQLITRNFKLMRYPGVILLGLGLFLTITGCSSLGEALHPQKLEELAHQSVVLKNSTEAQSYRLAYTLFDSEVDTFKDAVTTNTVAAYGSYQRLVENLEYMESRLVNVQAQKSLQDIIQHYQDLWKSLRQGTHNAWILREIETLHQRVEIGFDPKKITFLSSGKSSP